MKFTIIGIELYRLSVDGVLRRCVTISTRRLVITESHLGDAGGHFTIEITSRNILTTGLCWTTLYEDVKTYCKQCGLCQRIDRSTTTNMMPLTNITTLEPFIM